MKDDPRFGQLIGAQCDDLADCRDEGVFGVIGLDPGVLETRHIREVVEAWLLLDLADTRGDEVWEIVAVSDYQRRAWPVGAHVDPRYGAEEIVPHNPARDGIARLERANQSDRDIVAIDRKS